MPDFKNMTVEALRELARKIVGTGHSRLETKRDLVKALEAAEAKVAKAAGKATARIRAATKRAATAAKKGAKRVAKAGRKVRTKSKGRKGRPAVEARRKRPGKEAAAPRQASPEPEEPGLDPDGYFVARVRGEEAARQAPHPMTESAAEEQRRPALSSARPREIAGWEEGLGELPWSYEDDSLAALPRDPRTLFLYWDYSRSTLAQGFAGLEDARAQLWVFVRRDQDRFERVRTIDFALESRSYYVHDLEPGRFYRAEVHIVDRAGRERLLARPSNDVWLPSIGPSSVVDDRFARIPWDLPLSRWMREGHAGGPFSEEARALLARLSDWSRFSGRVWGGSAGGMGGRPFSPSGGPSSPPGSAPHTGKEGA